jgi:glycosyltransferase involved in cell wall biosynthesis
VTETTVSVIIAVRNGERFLGEALGSVLDQTRPPEEAIVIDDGSTDGTSRVVGEFPSVRYHRQSHAGQATALNRGVAMATGVFLAFLDADDLWCERKLQWQLAAFEEDPALEVVFGHAEQFLDRERGGGWREDPDRERPRHPAHLPGAMLIRRDAFHRVGSFDPRWSVGGVVDWYARARECQLRERMLSQTVLRRRIHDRNVGILQRHQREDYLRVVKAALDRRRR